MDGQSFIQTGKQHNNCLSFIRIIAALQVVFGHMLEHLQLPIDSTVAHATYFFRGVPIFFVISGFLIWFSIGRSSNYFSYLKKRFWRIYPELWMAVIIEVIVIAVLYRGWSFKQLLIFTVTQGTIFQFWTPSSLRGYGVGTPNGALWTIGVIIQFYIIAWFAYMLMKKRKLTIWISGLVISFGLSLVVEYVLNNILKVEVIGKLYDQTFVKYFWLFYIGMFIAAFKDKILPVLEKYWYVLLIAASIFFWTGWDLFSGYYLFWSLLLTASLIGFAYRFPKFAISTDVSYALFLYHMIVMNVFVNFGLTGNWIYGIAVLLFAIICAFVSTVTVGKWANKKKFFMINHRL